MHTKSQQKILIVGGAGYIGANMVHCAKRAGYIPIVLDNLSTGHREAVKDAELIIGDMRDSALLERIFSTHDIAAVMHFASYIQVGESVIDPAKYYENNAAATLNLMRAMVKCHVKYFIFSSTAAVYGEPVYTPIDEKHPIAPINPYGHSKRMVEQMLEDFSRSYDFKFTALRYFNAAGANPEEKLGERHEPETHLIPVVLQAADGKRKAITVYGTDYATPDGTGIRDYIHVTDLCSAHLLALEALWKGAKSNIYNLSTGSGYSVQQVIDTVREVTGRDVPVVYGERRSGDPAVLVGDTSHAVRELGWKPKYSDLKRIISDAWKAYLIFQQMEEVEH